MRLLWSIFFGGVGYAAQASPPTQSILRSVKSAEEIMMEEIEEASSYARTVKEQDTLYAALTRFAATGEGRKKCQKMMGNIKTRYLSSILSRHPTIEQQMSVLKFLDSYPNTKLTLTIMDNFTPFQWRKALYKDLAIRFRDMHISPTLAESIGLGSVNGTDIVSSRHARPKRTLSFNESPSTISTDVEMPRRPPVLETSGDALPSEPLTINSQRPASQLPTPESLSASSPATALPKSSRRGPPPPKPPRTSSLPQNQRTSTPAPLSTTEPIHATVSTTEPIYADPYTTEPIYATVSTTEPIYADPYTTEPIYATVSPPSVVDDDDLDRPPSRPPPPPPTDDADSLAMLPTQDMDDDGFELPPPPPMSSDELDPETADLPLPPPPADSVLDGFGMLPENEDMLPPPPMDFDDDLPPSTSTVAPADPLSNDETEDEFPLLPEEALKA